MNDRTLDHGNAIHAPGMIVATALRMIDTGARALARLRERLQPAVDDDGDTRSKSKKQVTADMSPEHVERSTPPHSLLHRTLVSIMLILLGVAAGSMFSYQALSSLIADHEANLEQMREEVEASRKDEAISLNLKAKYLNEVGDYRKRLHEARQEIEDYKDQVDALKARIAELKQKPGDRQNTSTTRPAAPAKTTSPVQQKTGSCVTGSGNAAGNVRYCLDQFNRP